MGNKTSKQKSKSEKVLEQELQNTFGKENATLKSFLITVTELNKPQSAITKIDKLISLLSASFQLSAIFTSNKTIKVMNEIFPILLNAFRNTDLVNVFGLSREKDKIYSELQQFEDSNLRSRAIGLETVFFMNHAYLNEINKKCDKSLIKNLEHTMSFQKAVQFLGELSGKIQDVLRLSDEIAAQRAIVYINLYFRLAILRSLAMWHVYCIKKPCGYAKSSTEGVLAMMKESHKLDIEMFEYVTKVSFDKVVFLSLFHPSENEHFLQFCNIKERIDYPVKSQIKGFNDQKNVVYLSVNGVKLEMPTRKDKCVWGTKTRSKSCSVTLEPPYGKEMDNIFFMSYTKEKNKYYITMKDNGYCYSLQEMPGYEGQWKMVRFEIDGMLPKVAISSLKWPRRFLILEEGFFGWLHIHGTYDVNVVRTKGLWEIHNL